MVVTAGSSVAVGGRRSRESRVHHASAEDGTGRRLRSTVGTDPQIRERGGQLDRITTLRTRVHIVPDVCPLTTRTRVEVRRPTFVGVGIVRLTAGLRQIGEIYHLLEYTYYHVRTVSGALARLINAPFIHNAWRRNTVAFTRVTTVAHSRERSAFDPRHVHRSLTVRPLRIRHRGVPRGRPTSWESVPDETSNSPPPASLDGDSSRTPRYPARAPAPGCTDGSTDHTSITRPSTVRISSIHPARWRRTGDATISQCRARYPEFESVLDARSKFAVHEGVPFSPR